MCEGGWGVGAAGAGGVGEPEPGSESYQGSAGAAENPALLPGSGSLTRDLLSPLLPPTTPLDGAWWRTLPQSSSLGEPTALS